MARVWLVHRRGAQWVAPGGAPAYEQPFADLIFPLDIGTHRRVSDDPPMPAPDEPPLPPEKLQKVLVEVEPQDLTGLEFSGYEPGIYDSALSPHEVVRRLGASKTISARRGAA